MKSDRLGVYTSESIVGQTQHFTRAHTIECRFLAISGVKMGYRDVLTWLQVLASSIRRLLSTSTSVCVVVMFFGTQSGISNSDNSES